MTQVNLPSEAELEILKAFWRLGPMSAREAHEAFGDQSAWASSTVRTMLERMKNKGILSRKSVHGVAVYSAASDKVSVLGGTLRKLFRQVLEIEGALPVSAFSGSQILSSSELEALETLLNSKEESKS